MGFSVASLRKVLLLVVLMSPVASSTHSKGVSFGSKLWRKESMEPVLTKKCEDKKTSCYDWHSKGYCTTESKEQSLKDMKKNCQKSCGFCKPQSDGDPLHLTAPTTPQAGTIDIEFGGDAHGQMTWEDKKGVKGVYLKRPEAVKSKACTTSGCEDCSSPANCWHGEDKTESGETWGYIALNVPKDSTFTHYVAEVWARCPSSSKGAEWYVEAPQSWRSNGVLEVYVGSEKVDTSQDKPELKLPISGQDTARIRILWYPDKDEESSVRVWLEAWKVDSSVDTCMAVKDCLDMLGDGSKEAFQLRNANDEQFSCLMGQSSGMSSGMQLMCGKWDNCVTKSGKKPLLLALLGAGVKKKESLLEGASFVNDTHRTVDTENCVNPEIDDPESWDCECAQEMTTTCSGPSHEGQDLETCLKTLLCKNPKVCSSWVTDHCEESLMEQRSQQSTKVARIEKLHNGLDSAVQGKCSQ